MEAMPKKASNNHNTEAKPKRHPGKNRKWNQNLVRYYRILAEDFLIAIGDGAQFVEQLGAPETEFLPKTRFLPHVSDFLAELESVNPTQVENEPSCFRYLTELKNHDNH